MRPQVGDSSEHGVEQEVEQGVDLIHRLDRMVSRVLAIGLALAVVLMVMGAVLALAGQGPSPSAEVSVADMPRALAALEPEGLLTLGLLVLLATPIARVLALTVGFARAKSRLFSFMSVMVMVILALSAYLGLIG